MCAVARNTMSTRSKSRWYVYELIDPRDGQVFYIGKGQKDRIFQHEREAERVAEVCSEKHKRIKDIWLANAQVHRRHVAYFWDEQAAYDFEYEAIEEFGLDRLTNQVPGGGSIRRRAHSVGPVPEWNALGAAKMIAGKSHLAWWFAKWLVGRETGRAFEVPGKGLAHAVVSVAMRYFPDLWDLVRRDPEALKIIAPAMSRHGVEFS